MTNEENTQVTLNYIYIFTSGQIIGTVYNLNSSCFYRKKYTENILLIIIYFLFTCYYISTLVISSRFYSNIFRWGLFFQLSNYELDFKDDINKTIIFGFYIGDLALGFASNLIVNKIIFSQKKKKKKVKK